MSTFGNLHDGPFRIVDPLPEYDPVDGRVILERYTDGVVRHAIEVRKGIEEEATLAAVVAELERRGYVVTPPETGPSYDPRGWFADRDEERAELDRVQWRPFLQLPGHVLPVDIWFRTEEDCLKFIREEIVGKGLLP